MKELQALRDADRILRDMRDQGGDWDLLYRVHVHIRERMWMLIEGVR